MVVCIHYGQFVPVIFGNEIAGAAFLDDHAAFGTKRGGQKTAKKQQERSAINHQRTGFLFRPALGYQFNEQIDENQR